MRVQAVLPNRVRATGIHYGRICAHEKCNSLPSAVDLSRYPGRTSQIVSAFLQIYRDIAPYLRRGEGKRNREA